MARCGCTSATCACSLTDGTNTTVSGDGSQATPYQVNVSCEAIVDCVGAALGCGLIYDDAANTISVRLSQQGGNTIQCLADGLFSTPGAVAIGCGLTTDGSGNIVVNTAGQFTDITRIPAGDATSGGARIALACAATNGQLVICDDNGDLRTAPEKYTLANAASSNEAITTNPVLTTTPQVVGNTIQISLTNPSPCYAMCGDLTYAVIPAISGAGGTVVSVFHELDLGTGAFTTATTAVVMDNRGKSATSGALGRYSTTVSLCLDPGETKVVRLRTQMERFTGDNGGATLVTALAKDLRFVGSNV